MTVAMAADNQGELQFERRRRARSIGIALGLGALVVIFYAATIVRLGPNAIRKDAYPGAGAKGNQIPITNPAVCKKAGTC